MSKSEPKQSTGPPAGKEPILIRLPKPLADQFRETAETNKRTLSAEAEIALQEHLDRENKEPAKQK